MGTKTCLNATAKKSTMIIMKHSVCQLYLYLVDLYTVRLLYRNLTTSFKSNKTWSFFTTLFGQIVNGTHCEK